MRYLKMILLIFVLTARDSRACTTFCIIDPDHVIFGRNYDWDIGNGMLMVNKRNVSKIAMPQQGEKSAKWISKYGSLTFNQYGREFPTGGINEAGLVVELMMLQETQYPQNNRPVVGCLEWIQYQLDNAQSISEVLENSRAIRISSIVKLHFLICERSGACVTAEFLNGLFTPHSGGGLPVAALTNDTYDKSLQYLRTISGFGGTSPVPSGQGSLERFARAASMIKNYQPGTQKNPVSYAFDVLGSVAQGDYTKWNIVYDLTKLRVYFRTSHSGQLKFLNLSKLNFDCGAPVQILNINTRKRGDAFKRLRKYSTNLNRNLVRTSYHNTPFLSGIPDSELEPLVQHPDTFTCLSN